MEFECFHTPRRGPRHRLRHPLLASDPRKPARHHVEDRRKQQAERGDADHAGEHRGAQRLPELRAGADRPHQRRDAEDKGDWKRPPAHAAIRYILQGLDPADVERVFREHAANLNSNKATAGKRILAFDGKVLKGSFDAFNDVARQMLSAFAVDTALVLAHIEIDEKSNEIPAVQKLLEELDVAG